MPWERLPCVVDDAGLRRNRTYAETLGLPVLDTPLPERPSALAIVGGGHSASLLPDTGPVMAINGAYDWLQSRGRVAEYMLPLDPEPLMADFLRNPQPGTQFITASMCDPSVFDALRGQNVLLWHVGTGEDCADDEIPGGPSAVTRAPFVGIFLGYRDFDIYGFDCCHRGTSHVYGGAVPPDAFRVRCDGAEYLVDVRQLQQAQWAADVFPLIDARITIHGDGFSAAMLRTRGAWERV